MVYKERKGVRKHKKVGEVKELRKRKGQQGIERAQRSRAVIGREGTRALRAKCAWFCTVYYVDADRSYD